jgi:hypothetical protein
VNKGQLLSPGWTTSRVEGTPGLNTPAERTRSDVEPLQQAQESKTYDLETRMSFRRTSSPPLQIYVKATSCGVPWTKTHYPLDDSHLEQCANKTFCIYSLGGNKNVPSKWYERTEPKDKFFFLSCVLKVCKCVPTNAVVVVATKSHSNGFERSTTGRYTC